MNALVECPSLGFGLKLQRAAQLHRNRQRLEQAANHRLLAHLVVVGHPRARRCRTAALADRVHVGAGHVVVLDAAPDKTGDSVERHDFAALGRQRGILPFLGINFLLVGLLLLFKQERLSGLVCFNRPLTESEP